MPESIVQVTEGTGKKLHTWQKTVGANTVEDEVVVLGEQYLASYTLITVAGVSVATALSHPFQLMAGATLRVYLRRLMIYQAAAATTAGFYDFVLVRLTTAGTGGAAITAISMDPADAASGVTGMSLPTVKGTEGNGLWRGELAFTQTIPVSPGSQGALLLDLSFDQLRVKPPIIAAGVANGIALKSTAGVTAATIAVVAYVSEANF